MGQKAYSLNLEEMIAVQGARSVLWGQWEGFDCRTLMGLLEGERGSSRGRRAGEGARGEAGKSL